MSFFRRQQENVAVRLLLWQYERAGLPAPEETALRAQATQLVDDAHRIAKARGKNVLQIMKGMAEDLIRKGSGK